jgi:hypothetical protein
VVRVVPLAFAPWRVHRSPDGTTLYVLAYTPDLSVSPSDWMHACRRDQLFWLFWTQPPVLSAPASAPGGVQIGARQDASVTQAQAPHALAPQDNPDAALWHQTGVATTSPTPSVLVQTWSMSVRHDWSGSNEPSRSI